jgi:hypothetical protein
MILFMVLILGGCDFGAATPLPLATPTMVATATPPSSGTNITQAQFDEALSRWRAQGVEEYELKIGYSAYSPLMGWWDLRVRASGDVSEVITYTRVGSLDAPTGGLGAQGEMPTAGPGIEALKTDLQWLTIEGQFAQIKALLDDPTSSRFEWAGYYVVTFDPTMGYPASVRTVNGSEPQEWGAASVTVLQRRPVPASTP